MKNTVKNPPLSRGFLTVTLIFVLPALAFLAVLSFQYRAGTLIVPGHFYANPIPSVDSKPTHIPSPVPNHHPAPVPSVHLPLDSNTAKNTSLAGKVIGLSEASALDALSSAGLSVRVVTRNGVSYPVTADYSDQRVNLTIVGNKVTAAVIG